MKRFKVNGVTFRTYKLRYLVQPEMNREANKSRAARIALKWDWHYADVFTVKPVPKSRKAHITNGGHRYTALLAKYPDMVDDNGKDIEVLCVVLPQNHDACDAFDEANKETKSVTANERFRCRLIAGKRPETQIVKALNAVGVQVIFESRKGRAETGTTRCAAKWLALYKAVGGNSQFKQLAELMAEIWWRPDHDTIENAALTGDFVEGLTLYMKRTNLTMLQVAAKLAERDEPAQNIHRWAEKKYMTTIGYSRANGIFLQLVDMIGGVDANKYATHKQAA